MIQLKDLSFSYLKSDGTKVSETPQLNNVNLKINAGEFVLVCGPTGSGKSWTGLSIAELLDPEFTADRVIFKARELMKLIRDGDLKPGSVILWDEAGIDLSNRNWQSVTNRMLKAKKLVL
jgi:ABC-type lipoprotein export system ATPase subunit